MIELDPIAPTVCFELTDTVWPIKLEQNGPDNFTVIYGLQEHCHLTYASAARSLGEAIMHALACDGKLDNSEAS